MQDEYKIFETHAHYDDCAFDTDREDLLGSFPENNICCVMNIGANMKTTYASVDLTEKYPYIYAAIGVHPSDVTELDEECINRLKELAANEKVKAIGEIGLDYHYDEPDRDTQIYWFKRQLELAREACLPTVIHSRDAAKDTLDVMKELAAEEMGGVIHCFSYGCEMARQFLDMGYFLGIGGVLTFKNARKLKEVVEYAPLDRLVLETDAPYLSPEPFRGKRNTALNIPYVAEEIAHLKGITTKEVYDATYENALRLYRF